MSLGIIYHELARADLSGSPTIEVDGEVIERRVSTTGFPYLARYRIIDDTILVMAFYHQRRHPDFGADRKR